MLDVKAIAAAVKGIAVGESAVIAGLEVSRASKGKYLVSGKDAGPGVLAAGVIADMQAAAIAAANAESADLPAESGTDTESDAADLQAAADADAAESARLDALDAQFVARRCALPADKVLETDALADSNLRTITPRLLDAIAADPALYVTGIPALASIGKFMAPVRITGRESRPDARIPVTSGGYAESYDGICFIVESTKADGYHKTSRRTLMLSESLATEYESTMPAKAARPVATRVSKAAAGVDSLTQKAADAQAALDKAQAKAAAAKAALDTARAAAQPAAAPAIILPGHLQAPAADAPRIIIARR